MSYQSTKNQMVNFFEKRLTELTQRIEGNSSPYDVDMFPKWNLQQRKSLVDLYNLNLDLLKIWNPDERRLRINRLR
jgi:hypothetical protein